MDKLTQTERIRITRILCAEYDEGVAETIIANCEEKRPDLLAQPFCRITLAARMIELYVTKS